jgi:hypothetical protein
MIRVTVTFRYSCELLVCFVKSHVFRPDGAFPVRCYIPLNHEKKSNCFLIVENSF